jgi:hypothetical protein
LESSSKKSTSISAQSSKIGKLASTDFYAGKVLKKYGIEDKGQISNNSRFLSA